MKIYFENWTWTLEVLYGLLSSIAMTILYMGYERDRFQVSPNTASDFWHSKKNRHGPNCAALLRRIHPRDQERFRIKRLASSGSTTRLSLHHQTTRCGRLQSYIWVNNVAGCGGNTHIQVSQQSYLGR